MVLLVELSRRGWLRYFYSNMQSMCTTYGGGAEELADSSCWVEPSSLPGKNLAGDRSQEGDDHLDVHDDELEDDGDDDDNGELCQNMALMMKKMMVMIATTMMTMTRMIMTLMMMWMMMRTRMMIMWMKMMIMTRMMMMMMMTRIPQMACVGWLPRQELIAGHPWWPLVIPTIAIIIIIIIVIVMRMMILKKTIGNLYKYIL